MDELIQTNELNYKDYKTKVLTQKALKEFLMVEAIPCLSSRFKDPEQFYESIIFKIPETKEHKNFKMIYTHLIDPVVYNYVTKEELIKKWNIKEKDLLAEGSVTLLDTSYEKNPFVRWMIVKDTK